MPEERRGRVARNAARPMIEAIVKGVCMWCGRVERERVPIAGME
jgi:hypothetical protein